MSKTKRGRYPAGEQHRLPDVSALAAEEWREIERKREQAAVREQVADAARAKGWRVKDA